MPQRNIAVFLLSFIFLASWLSVPIAAAPEQSIAETQARSANTEQDLTGRVVILDPGHGRGNSPSFAGYVEHEAMFALANKIKPLLEARGATVLMTRTCEEDVPLSVRVALINKWALEAIRDARLAELSHTADADAQRLQDALAEIDRLLRIPQSIIDNPRQNASTYLNTPFSTTRSIHPDTRRIFELQGDPIIRERFLMISLHSNATGTPVNTAVNGAIAFYISNNLSRNASYFTSYSHVEQNRHFSNLIIEGIDRIGIRKVEARPFHFFMLREHNVPASLVENGFHTNPHDRALLSCNEFLARLAAVYDEAIFEYFTSHIGPLTSISPIEPLEPISPSISTADEWARAGIDMAINRGFVQEEIQYNFRDVITREEFARLAVHWVEYALARSIDGILTERGLSNPQNPFTDTDNRYVLAAYALGITNGIGEGLFNPQGSFTRQQAATMLTNTMRVIGQDVDNPPFADFVDMNEADVWAIDAIRFVRANRIMSGTGEGSFSPHRTFTRQESIITFNNVENQGLPGRIHFAR